MLKVIESDPEDEVDSLAAAPAAAGTAYSMDTDISQLEAPTFTTLDRGPSQKMMELSWDHKVNLIGKKVGLRSVFILKYTQYGD